MPAATLYTSLSDDGIATGAVDNVHIAIVRKTLTPERFTSLEAGVERLRKEHPGGLSFMAILADGTEPPSRKMRVRIKEHVEARASYTGCDAIVLESPGFSGAILRTVMRGVSGLVSRELVRSFFAEVDPAAKWLVSASADAGVPVAASAEEISAAVADVRRLFEG